MPGDNMKFSRSSVLIVLAGAVLHGSLTIAFGLLSFAGSFGAPQGGDAVKPGGQHDMAVAFIRGAVDTVFTTLVCPLVILTRWVPLSLTQVRFLWILNSLVWGLFVLFLFRYLQKNSR